MLSVEQADLSLIHSNKSYHVCTQWQPALHQLKTASVFVDLTALKGLIECQTQYDCFI